LRTDYEQTLTWQWRKVGLGQHVANRKLKKEPVQKMHRTRGGATWQRRGEISFYIFIREREISLCREMATKLAIETDSVKNETFGGNS